jgi:hypothetical protein
MRTRSSCRRRRRQSFGPDSPAPARAKCRRWGRSGYRATGLASALEIGRPPAGSAGKNFRTFKAPRSRTSLRPLLATPGRQGRPVASIASVSFGLRPGLTRKPAPSAWRCCGLLRRAHRAHADDQLGLGVLHRLHGVQRDRRAQGQLHDAKAARFSALARGAASRRLDHGENRDDAGGVEDGGMSEWDITALRLRRWRPRPSGRRRRI